ncbi:unnamed protein product [Schistocephalus solidus]|uniref:DUF4485 domain-containing protein n=1 Tax=Schistocephalus solidus TaxID=70667 RepID=A0A183TP18_SCHSO|nr:unnamed protein product [Schistocephalus solidus]
MEEEEEVLKSQEDGLKSDFQDLKAQIEENELIHGIPSKGMSASESLLARNDNCLEDIEYEDYLIYWKHMIVKLQSQTYFKQIIALLKWFPYGHREGFKQDLSQRPQHLAHYDDDGGITEMLNRVIEKGPATLRAAMANGLSTSTSEDGGGSADRAGKDQVDLESMRADSEAIPAPIGAAVAASTDVRDSDTDDDIAGGTSAALSGSDSGGAVRSGSTIDSAPSRGPSEEVEPQEANAAAGGGSSQDGGMPTVTDTAEGGAASAEASETKQKVTNEGHRGEKRSLISGGGIAVGTIDQAFRFTEHTPQPPGIFMANLAGSGMPLPPTTKNIQYAACGGGLVTNERYHGLPLHTNDIENLRPHLVIFAKAYGIQMGGSERWGFDSYMHAVKKPANWLPYVKLRPKRNADLVKSQMELRSAGNIDEILRASAAFLKVKQPEVS